MDRKLSLLIFSITGEMFLLNQLVFHFDEQHFKAFVISLSFAVVAGIGVHLYRKKQQNITLKN